MQNNAIYACEGGGSKVMYMCGPSPCVYSLLMPNPHAKLSTRSTKRSKRLIVHAAPAVNENERPAVSLAARVEMMSVIMNQEARLWL